MNLTTFKLEWTQKFNALTDEIEKRCRERDAHYTRARKIDHHLQPLIKRAAEMLREEDVVEMREV